MNQSHVSWLTVIPCINSSGGDDRSPAIPTWSVTSPFCTCMPADLTGSQVIGRCARRLNRGSSEVPGGCAEWCLAPLVGGSEHVGVARCLAPNAVNGARHAETRRALVLHRASQAPIRAVPWLRALSTEPGTHRRDGLSFFTGASLAPIRSPFLAPTVTGALW